MDNQQTLPAPSHILVDYEIPVAGERWVVATYPLFRLRGGKLAVRHSTLQQVFREIGHLILDRGLPLTPTQEEFFMDLLDLWHTMGVFTREMGREELGPRWDGVRPAGRLLDTPSSVV